MNQVNDLLEAAGYVKDGLTLKHNRQRYVLTGTDRRATLGPEAVNFYKINDGNEHDGYDWTNFKVSDRRGIEEHIKRPPDAFRITQSDAIQLIDAIVNGRVSFLALGIAQRMKEHFMLKETLHNVEHPTGV